MSEKVTASKVPFDDLFAWAPFGALVIDEAGIIVAANHELVRMLGHGAEELLGHPYSKLVPVAARERHAALDARYRQHPEPRRIGGGPQNLTALHKDGHEVDVEISLNKVTFDGRPLMVAFIVDVTERRKLERNLRQSESHLRELLDQVPDGLLVMDVSERKFVDANASALRLFELTRAQLLATPFGGLSPELQPNGRASVEQLSEHVAAVRQYGSAEFEWRFRAPSGAERTCGARMNRISGSPHLIRASLVDLTARKSAEERYRSIFENSSDGMLLLDRTAHISKANDCAATMARLSDPRDLIGKHLLDLIAPEDHAKTTEAVRRILSRERVLLDNLRTAGVDDDHLLVDLRGVAIDFDGEPFILVTMRDATERQELLGQIATSDRMISIGMLTAGVAHEINNPLASVIVNIEMAREDLSALPPEADASLVGQLHDELDDASRGADRVRQIVQDLRRFSRAGDVQVGPIDVIGVLDSSLRMAWNEIRPRATVVKRYTKVPMVAINEGKLGQVLLNLIINAAQAIPEGHSGENEIVVSTGIDERGRVLIGIADTGCGFSLDTSKRLFSAFFTTKPAGVGTGLGLSISRSIIQQAGGDITAENQPERGAIFTISLPATRAAAVIEPLPLEAAPVAQPRGRILVIDDEKAVAVAVQRALTHEHDVVIETDSEHALERIKGGQRFDVIISDLMMPRLDGSQLLAAIQQLDSAQAARLMFLTGGAFTPDGRAFLASVSDRVLQKPFAINDLRAAVALALAR